MSRLQFIHFDGASNNISRQDAVNYIKRLTDISIREDMRFDKSLIGEPIAVTYLDENDKVQVILGIGTKGEKNGEVLEPYHIIDSAFLEEQISSLSGDIVTLRQDLETEIERATAAEQTIQNELDITQEGAGLNPDGTYSVNLLANYINNATSLSDADNKLDSELKRVETARKNVTGQEGDTYQPNESLISRPLNYITGATSLNDADIKLDEGIQSLDSEAVKNIIVNGVEGTVENNVAEVTIVANDINIGEYENYNGKAVKPHPIHDNYSVLDSIKQLDLNFIDFAEKEELERKGIHIVKVTSGLDPNVKEGYDLVDKSGNTMPNSERILIYKDSSLYRAYLGHVDDRLDDYTSPVVTPGTGDTALCFIYLTNNGTYQLVTINIEDFLQENEFKDGLVVDNHTVSVLIDETSEEFLTVSQNGVKVSGIHNAISGAVYNEEIRAKAAESAEENRATAAEQALQQELDITQEGAGLNPDGTYKRHNTSEDFGYYINSATSLDKADVILDTELKRVEDKIDESTGDLEVLSGVVRDFSASTVNEVERLDGRVNDEIQRAVEAENTISGVVNTLSAATVGEVGRLDGRINTETERATVAEGAISGTVNTFSAATVNEFFTTNNAIVAEVNRAIAAESAITRDLTNLTDNVNNLSAATISENTRLNGKIDDEINRAKGVEESLSGSLMSIETALNIEIDRAKGVENNITTTTRNIQNELDAVERGAGLYDDGTYKQHNTVGDMANYIYDAFSLDKADVILDAELKRVEDKVDVDKISLNTLSGSVESFIENTTSNFNNVNNELTTTQTGAGLNNDGTYKPHNQSPSDLANYINTATSLNDADFILDRELKRVENTLSGSSASVDVLSGVVRDFSAATVNRLDSVQSELDDTQQSVGLNADGSYSPNIPSYYISGATSVKDADRLLDSEIHSVKENLNSEIQRAVEAENAISGVVNTLSAATVGEVGRLDGRINTETERATVAENTISGSVYTLSGNVIALSSATVTNVERIDDLISDLSGATSDALKSNKVHSDDTTIIVTTNELGTNLSVNVDDTTIVKDRNGVLSTHLNIVKLATPSSTNIKDEYVLLDNNDVQHGESIKIYKDSSLQSVELITISGKQYLRFTYVIADGTTQVVDLDISQLIVEEEFKDGLRVSGSNVYVKIDAASENFLTVSSDGVKLSGVQNAISGAVYNEEVRAKAAESSLSGSVDTLRHNTEVSAHTLSDDINTLRHNTEVSADTLNVAINNLRTDATNSADTLNIAIQNEVTRATNRENDLTSQFNTVNSGLTSEKERAQRRENELNDAISSEANTRSTADSAQAARITNLETGLTVTNNNLQSEITRATNRETSIGENLATLSGETQAFITQLPGQIDKQVGDKFAQLVLASEAQYGQSATTQNSLLRYWTDGINYHYWASNDTKDMIYSGETLEEVITSDKARIATLEAELSALTINIDTIIYNKVARILQAIEDDQKTQIKLVPDSETQTIQIGFADYAKMDSQTYDDSTNSTDYTTD